jgi:hypothetical protein
LLLNNDGDDVDDVTKRVVKAISKTGMCIFMMASSYRARILGGSWQLVAFAMSANARWSATRVAPALPARTTAALRFEPLPPTSAAAVAAQQRALWAKSTSVTTSSSSSSSSSTALPAAAPVETMSSSISGLDLRSVPRVWGVTGYQADLSTVTTATTTQQATPVIVSAEKQQLAQQIFGK